MEYDLDPEMDKAMPEQIKLISMQQIQKNNKFLSPKGAIMVQDIDQDVNANTDEFGDDHSCSEQTDVASLNNIQMRHPERDSSYAISISALRESTRKEVRGLLSTMREDMNSRQTPEDLVSPGPDLRNMTHDSSGIRHNLSQSAQRTSIRRTAEGFITKIN